MWNRKLRGVVAAPLLVLSLAPALAGAQSTFAWPDTFTSRLEALALIQSLDAEILASRSATFTLEKWCVDHRLSGDAEPKIVAHPAVGADKPPSAEQRERLGIAAGDAVKFRHVQLLCGARVFSEADNWYVPGRLTAEMNRLLDSTTTPFGKAVQELKPYRRTFEAKLLWQPLPEGWELRPTSAVPADAARPLSIPDALFEHRAILYTQDGKPFSEVDEVYQRALLDFPPVAAQ